jgi:ABC-type multidrug transport system fused ATPase/permease subunit
MLDTILITALAGASHQVGEIVLKAVKEYVKKKGKAISESPTESEIIESLASIEAGESTEVKIAEAQDVFDNAISRLATFRGERERQARNSYNLAWVVLGAGSGVVLAGIAWMVVGSSLVPGTVTSAVGAVTSLCSGAIFKFANDANDRLDETSTYLHKIESARMASEIVQKINNEEEKNAAIKQIATSLGQLQSRQRVPTRAGAGRSRKK